MKRLADTAGRTLLWIQRSMWMREFELRDGEEVCARLSWPYGLVPPVDAEAEEGHWIFRRRGWLRSGAHVFESGSDAPVATFRRSWGGGTLYLQDGREFRWKRISLLRWEWVFEKPDGSVQVRLRHRFTWMRTAATLTLSAGVDPHDAALLSLFGWYLMLHAHRQAHGG